MTRVAILWHMHQPFYQDLATGEHILPWVRLHGIKDYWGMVALLREFPQVRVTFNLVPSLLVQLEAFARDEARDRHLALGLKPADALTEDERAFCVENFFHAHRAADDRSVPAVRGAARPTRQPRQGTERLAHRRRSSRPTTSATCRSGTSWCGSTRCISSATSASGRWSRRAAASPRRTRPLLRSVELEILRAVVPEYRDAARRGQVELSTSPFYHPILPLLCDTDVYLRTHPQSRMPRERFRTPRTPPSS